MLPKSNPKSLICSLMLVILLSLFASGGAIAQIQPQYRFAYLQVDESGTTAQLVLINPQNMAEKVDIRELPLPTGWRNVRMMNSLVTHNNWIATFLTTPDGTKMMVQLYNLNSSESRTIVEGPINAIGHSILWSPDGNYLALSMIEIDEQKDVDLWVYSIADNKLNNVSNDDFDQRDMVWSADSRSLITFVAPCEPSIGCAHQLEIFDVPNGTKSNSIDLDSLPLKGGDACGAAPSPNNRFVSFVSNCERIGAVALEYSSEVMLWDIQAKVLKQISNYYVGVEGKLFSASYSYVWSDNNTLLIGADYQTAGQLRSHHLLTYHLDNSESTSLAADVGYGFVVSPLMNYIALTTYISDDPNKFSAKQVDIRVSLIRINGEDVNIGDSGPILRLGFVCDAQWSPDEALVAYHWVNGSNCLVGNYKISFIDQQGKLVGEISAEAEDRTMPIGWVQLAPQPQ